MGVLQTGRPGWARALTGVLVAALVTAAAVVLARAGGLPATRVDLAGGSAWLASPAQGLVTLLDGPTEEVVGSVRVPPAVGGDVSVVQAGPSAYMVGAAGTVSRVDGGTYEVSTPVQFGAGGVQVHAGGASTYVVDGRRGTASVVDPVSLRVRARLALAATPGPGQSVVDGAGRLWVVDRGGVAWFDGAGKHVRPDAGGPDARLLLVRGRPVVVDLAQARVAPLTDGAEPPAWSCLDIPAGGRPALLGSATLDRVVAATPLTGALVLAGAGRDECGRSVPVGEPGDEFGPLVESAGYILVPNRSRGRTVVVEIGAGRVVADLRVVAAGHRLELVPQDGLVFYNDLDGDRAGVIRFDGRQWTAGAAVRKYRVGDAGLLTPAGQVAGRPRNERPEPDRPGGADPDQDRDRPEPGQGDPGDPGGPGAGGSDGSAGGPGGTQPGGTGGTQPGPGGPPAPTDGPPVPHPDPTRPVTLTVQVAGAGTVTAQQPAPLNAPAGAQCTADASCTWQYPSSTTVTLRIPTAPSPGVLLSGVTGCDRTAVAGADTECVLTLATDATVRATFTRDDTPGPATLTVTRAGPGTLTATAPGRPAETCDPTCTLAVPAGTPVDLSAAPAGDSYLSDWGAAGCGSAAPTCSVPVAADRTVTVTFLRPIELTVSLAGSGSVAGSGLACAGNTCRGSYRAGTVVALTATPDPGFEFAGWNGCASTSETCTLTVTTTETIVATFVPVGDRTPPDPRLSHVDDEVGVDTGPRSVEYRNVFPTSVTATASDPESSITVIEIWGEVRWECRLPSGGVVPGGEPERVLATGSGDSLVHRIRDSGVGRCPTRDSSIEVIYHLRARAASAGGMSPLTDFLTITFRQGDLPG